MFASLHSLASTIPSVYHFKLNPSLSPCSVLKNPPFAAYLYHTSPLLIHLHFYASLCKNSINSLVGGTYAIVQAVAHYSKTKRFYEGTWAFVIYDIQRLVVSWIMQSIAIISWFVRFLFNITCMSNMWCYFIYIQQIFMEQEIIQDYKI